MCFASTKMDSMVGSSVDEWQGIGYVFLDRDGVINRKPSEDRTIHQWSDFEILPGVETAIARLNACGFKVIVVTNQRGIALGRYTTEQLEDLHSRLREHLTDQGAHLDAIYYCPHDRNECHCRKPESGMFEQAFAEFPGASAANSVVIGDSISDIEAGERLGMRTIFVEGDPRFQKAGAERAAKMANRVVPSLHSAVFELLAAIGASASVASKE